MRQFAVATAAALTAVLLAGCQPTVPPTTPTPTTTPTTLSPVPTPTYLCTPEAGGEATPCSQIDYEQMKAKDALYTEAEAVYRKLFAESIRLNRAGGVSAPTEVMLSTTTGDYLDDLLASFRGQLERGSRARGDDPTIVWIQRLAGQSKAGSEVALAICVDSTGWGYYIGDERVTDGVIAIDETYFARFDGVMKAIGADGKETDSCE